MHIIHVLQLSIIYKTESFFEYGVVKTKFNKVAQRTNRKFGKQIEKDLRRISKEISTTYAVLYRVHSQMVNMSK